jgi:hypothetical protein
MTYGAWCPMATGIDTVIGIRRRLSSSPLAVAAMFPDRSMRNF